MKFLKTIYAVAFATLTFAARAQTPAQSQFTDAEAEGIKAFLRDNFRETNACIVIGLVDENRRNIFTARGDAQETSSQSSRS